MTRILVIDDDDLMRAFVVTLLEKRHYSVAATAWPQPIMDLLASR